jgi:hypothetical protein
MITGPVGRPQYRHHDLPQRPAHRQHPDWHERGVLGNERDRLGAAATAARFSATRVEPTRLSASVVSSRPPPLSSSQSAAVSIAPRRALRREPARAVGADRRCAAARERWALSCGDTFDLFVPRRNRDHGSHTASKPLVAAPKFTPAPSGLGRSPWTILLSPLHLPHLRDSRNSLDNRSRHPIVGLASSAAKKTAKNGRKR